MKALHIHQDQATMQGAFSRTTRFNDYRCKEDHVKMLIWWTDTAALSDLRVKTKRVIIVVVIDPAPFLVSSKSQHSLEYYAIGPAP